MAIGLHSTILGAAAAALCLAAAGSALAQAKAPEAGRQPVEDATPTRGGADVGLYVSITAMATAGRPDEPVNRSTGALSGHTAREGDLNTGIAFAPNIAVGYSLARWGSPFRADVEYTIRGKTFYSADPMLSNGNTPFTTKLDGVIKTQSLLFNVYLDTDRFPIFGFNPFLNIGAGVGFTVGEAQRMTNGAGQLERVDHRNTNFAYALGFGAAKEFKPGWNLDLRYRYVDLGEVEFGPTTSSGGTRSHIVIERNVAHELGFGFRYSF